MCYNLKRREYRIVESDLCPGEEGTVCSLLAHPLYLHLSWTVRGIEAGTRMRCECHFCGASAEWLADERARVVGTLPPTKRGWTG